ncbi:nucleotide sugar dehydrogenase [Sporolactobacillus sp. CQH2019]|uniref:nucleotide sugar dehydrogenase n=1 Tax=Sporolactobacillus sp. CQH2019 TaxID=3023512 RepID=UPI002367D89B|nr:nucleotide sugar dehydrogenase [Sporolactobacillus sp. CQH2019]MDD9148429.1 nucleotide sugar dehydrogenase [Sporolactobacillus sp. CQH2019]
MQKREQRSIAVIGLGFVGLPLCQLFLQNGYTVHGIDVDEAKLKGIRTGNSNNPDVDGHFIQQTIRENRFFLHHTGKGIAGTEAVFICVPTPLTGSGNPELIFVKKAVESILPHLEAGQLICLESTTYPGTTDELILPRLEEKGWTVGKDIFLAYSPERINPGSHIPLKKIPKVVGGTTPQCLGRISAIYRSVFDEVFEVSSTRAAEMTKILENTQRFINISFINDFAILCEKMNIDVYEVIEAASTKPYGFSRYTPSAGIGGHCIPIDPLYLSWKAKEYNHETPFIHTADAVNKKMPQYVTTKIKNLLKGGKTVSPPSILLVGVAYKKDIGDVRESPAIPIIRLLVKDGFHVDYYDPFVPSLTVDSTEYVSIDRSALASVHYDLAVVITDHSTTPYETIKSHIPVVIDTKQLFLPASGTRS